MKAAYLAWPRANGTPWRRGAPTGRWYHTAVWTGTKMIVWGGIGGTFLNTGGQHGGQDILSLYVKN